MTHLYVYAAVAGRPADRAVSDLPTMPDGEPPRIIPLDENLSLAVADVPSTIYNAETLESRLSDLDWVSRCGSAHHAVADKLAESHVVLPFRLFTLFTTEAKAVATLRKSRARLARVMTRIKGRQEWVLRIGRPDPARMAAPDAEKAPETAAPTGTSFLRAKADRRREETERAARVTSDAAALFETLRDMADAARARPIEPEHALLLDAAFLVAEARIPEFHQALSHAAEGLLRDGCPVSLTGPWPPYSFASLDEHG